MIIKEGKIIEATRNEMWQYWYDRELFECYSFDEYLYAMKIAGVKIIKEDKQ